MGAPAIATQDMLKVDQKRKRIEKKIGKKIVWSLLNERPPDAVLKDSSPTYPAESETDV